MLCWAAAWVCFQACGGKTGLTGGSTRQQPALDGSPLRLEIDCGRSEQYTSPGRPITIVCDVAASGSIAGQDWTLVSVPTSSTSTLSASTGESTTLTPDSVGDYALEFEAYDAAGNRQRVQIIVHSVVGPPAAICPEAPLLTLPNQELLVEGSGYDDVEVTGYLWEIVAPARPVPGTVLAPRDQPATRFQTTDPGRYQLHLTVHDGDGGSDSCVVIVNVAEPPEALCPESPIEVATRTERELTASAIGDATPLRAGWELFDRPARSNAELAPTTGETMRFTPDRQGEYRLRFTVEDDLGQRDTCEVRVIGTPTPPALDCPAQVDTRPLVDTAIRAAVVDDGDIVTHEWTLESTPDGSDANPPNATDSPQTEFRPDIAGIYSLELRVVDDDGQTARCTIPVHAVATEGLRIELFWDSAPDMDLHLLHPEATTWHSALDCHYANCVGSGGLPWYSSGEEDNPRLDIDDVTSYGPENINIDSPEPGTYRVGVHAYFGDSQSVTVRVYCGGSTTSPRATYGPVALPDNYLWRIVDVTITNSGCSLTDLTNPDGSPNIDPYGLSAEPR
jgi:uncharacterized protein YfaP (DUF2135 family)